ncbi:hypothetical protein V3C99_018466, partial [Haemonchus contortus]
SNKRKMSLTPRYLWDFASLPAYEGEETESEPDTNSEGVYSDEEEEKACEVCGGCSAHRETVSNITACITVCEQNTIESGKRMAHSLGVLQSLERKLQQMYKHYTHLLYLRGQQIPKVEQLTYINFGLLHGEVPHRTQLLPKDDPKKK